jgi:hypothetical protein
MAQPRQNRSRRKAAKPVDMWRAVPEAPEPDDITPAVEPTALLRSLGDPPLHGQRVTAGHYLAAVIERAAALATGLAASADLLAPEGVDEAEPADADADTG